ncbi:hypothetical protein H6504_04205 [Candidatus Woesearchaeota archaeon]|nr:hypothetical protein [Candidatus Woesearchaeota archaeon]
MRIIEKGHIIDPENIVLEIFETTPEKTCKDETYLDFVIKLFFIIGTFILFRVIFSEQMPAIIGIILSVIISIMIVPLLLLFTSAFSELSKRLGIAALIGLLISSSILLVLLELLV